MRERGRWWVVAAVMCGLVAACTTASTPATRPIEWAQRAEQYFTAFHEAQGVGFTNLASFYTAGAHVDDGLLIHNDTGRPQAIQAMRDSAQSPPVSFGGRDPADNTSISFDEPLYVSRDGAVDVARITPVDYIIPTASAYRLSPEGIASQTWTGSLAAGESYTDLDPAPYERIAADYVNAWAAGDSDAVARLYGAEARVDDSLAGLHLRGADRIGAAARNPWADGGLTGAVLRDIAQDGGPAIYVNGESTGSAPIDRMVLLLHIDSSDGCPGNVAVALHLDGSTILAEERHHRIDSPSGCWDAALSGWWDDIRIPDPHAVVRTGTLRVSELDIAIWNGTPDPSPLLTWGLQRFAEAGLPAPIPTSVTFLPRGDDPWLAYGFEEGTTAPDLALPFPASEACLDADCTSWPTAAKAATLHQLAHVYLADPEFPRWEDPLTGPSRIEPYRTSHDLTWLDPGEPWNEQASQLAAETVAWGLMDEPYTVDARMGSPTCPDLAEDFTLLTGSTPEPRACPTGAAEPAGEPPRPEGSTAPMPPQETALAGPAAAAERWFDAYDAALDHGILDLYGYYSSNVAFDHRALGVNPASGRDALREHLTMMAGAPLLQRDPIGPLFVSRTGAVGVAALPGSMKAAFVRSLAATGITSETYAPSLVTLRAAHPNDERLGALHTTADAYVSAWAGQDGAAVADLYIPDATITDNLLDITAAGTDDVRALGRAGPAEGGLPDSALVALPDLGGPAVFATGDADPGDPLDTVVLLLAADAGCPSHLAVVLRLDADGLITEEIRHHAAADLGGCQVPQPPSGGWWEEVAIPPGVSVGHSGTLTVADRALEVRNSSPALDRLIGWGLGRFTEAGLVAPGVDSVTFVDRKAPACAGINGLAAGDAVSLCFGTSDACTDDGCAGWRPWARKALLHEFSHLWLAQNVTPETQSTFLRASGLPAWESPDLLWGQRGVELAAEAMAGALMDEAVTPNVELARNYACDQWAQMYTILTDNALASPTCPTKG